MPAEGARIVRTLVRLYYGGNPHNRIMIERSMSGKPPIPTRQAMAAGAAAPIRPGTIASRAAAAIEAHGARPGSAWPQLTGDQQMKNSAAQRLVEEILNDPSSMTIVRPNHPRFGDCVDIIAVDGRALRYDEQGNLITVLEPAP